MVCADVSLSSDLSEGTVLATFGKPDAPATPSTHCCREGPIPQQPPSEHCDSLLTASREQKDCFFMLCRVTRIRRFWGFAVSCSEDFHMGLMFAWTVSLFIGVNYCT